MLCAAFAAIENECENYLENPRARFEKKCPNF
jgi:hypothetical protein